MPFDLSMTKLLVLGVIALIVFGPDKLPQAARDAGRMLRQLRSFAQQARADLKSELGDTIGDFDVTDLNPRTFVRKHLFEDDMPVAQASNGQIANVPPQATAPALAGAQAATLQPGTPAPYDPEAT